MSIKKRPTEEFIGLLKRSGSADRAVALEAQREIAKALETPLREGVVFGDVVTSIYEAMPLEPGASPEFPLDLLAPGTEGDHIAYTNPGNGRIPERHVEGDYVMINTYGITSSIEITPIIRMVPDHPDAAHAVDAVGPVFCHRCTANTTSE